MDGRIIYHSTVDFTEARIAGFNLYELNTFSAFRGTVGIYSTKTARLSIFNCFLVTQ